MNLKKTYQVIHNERLTKHCIDLVTGRIINSLFRQTLTIREVGNAQHTTKKNYSLTKIAFSTLSLSVLAIFTGWLSCKWVTKDLDSSQMYPDSTTWDTYSLGCFTIQVPSHISLIGTFIAEEDWYYEFTPKIKDADTWGSFLRGVSQKYPFSISFTEEIILREEKLISNEFMSGGLKGQWAEEEKSGLYSGSINLQAPFPIFSNRPKLNFFYAQATASDRDLMLEIAKTVRYDTTLYTDKNARFQTLPLEEYWSNFDPNEYWDDSKKIRISEYDSAYEQMPINDPSIEQHWYWTRTNMECLRTDLTPRRVGIFE